MRIEQLTFTRFIAAISIVIFHYGRGTFFYENENLSFIFGQANVGVSYFFILSGFVMIIAYGGERISFLNYMKSRLARIYPVYLLAIYPVISMFSFHNINKSDLALNLFMVQSWFPAKALTINPPGWSLSVELFFYLSFPFLLNNIYLKKKLSKITIGILIFWLISQLLFHLIVSKDIVLSFFSIVDIHYHPLMHLNEFLIGNLAGLYFIRYLKFRQKNYLPHIIIGLFFLIILLKFPIGFNFHNGLLALIFIPLILYISLDNQITSEFFSKRIFVFLGEISFSIYILQFPIWTFLSDNRLQKDFRVPEGLDANTLFFIRLFILILISSSSYLLFEKPLRKKIKLLTLKS